MADQMNKGIVIHGGTLAEGAAGDVVGEMAIPLAVLLIAFFLILYLSIHFDGL